MWKNLLGEVNTSYARMLLPWTHLLLGGMIALNAAIMLAHRGRSA
jgi:hypothetical protein